MIVGLSTEDLDTTKAFMKNAPVSYPILSEMQNDKVKIAESYKKLMKITFFITTPLIFSAIIIAEPLFLLVLGEEWIIASKFKSNPGEARIGMRGSRIVFSCFTTF